MPYRLLSSNFTPYLAAAVEAVVLSTLALWQGALALISDGDWNRITGDHGLVFVLIIGLVTVWGRSIRQDAARERRHKESIKAQEDHFDKLVEINEKTAEDLRGLSIAATKAQMSSTTAIISMDKNIQRLTTDLSDRIDTMNTFCKTK